jgi:hypothetical protein
VSGADGGARLQKIRDAKPIGTAFNATGRVAFTAAFDRATEDALVVALVQIRKGKVNLRAYATLAKPAKSTAKAVGQLGVKVKISKLERALHQEPFPRSWVKHSTLTFAAKPRSPKGADRELYKKQFLIEMDRQLKVQERGLNRLTVDTWVKHLLLFSMDPKKFAELDRIARLDLLKELMDRAAKALTLTQDRLVRLEKAKAEAQKKGAAQDAVVADLKKQIKSAEAKEARIEAAQEEIESSQQKNLAGAAVAPRRDIVQPYIPKTVGTRYPQRYQDKILGRLGGEEAIRRKIGDDRELLAKEVAGWQELLKDGRGLNVLHNPDQVAGGYDEWPPLPKRPADNADDRKWAYYFRDLKRFIGPAAVNAAIGKGWRNEIDTKAFPDVKRAIPEPAFGIHKLNFTLERK